MGIFGRFGRHRQTESTSISVGRTAALLGRHEYPALADSSFWSCLTDIVRTFGTMPWKLYRNDLPVKKEISDRNNPYRFLMTNPAPYLNGVEWRMIMSFNFELFGQAMAIIVRSGGAIAALLPVSPNLLAPFWRKEKDLLWRYTPTGQVFEDSDILRFTNVPTGYASVLDPSAYAKDVLEVARNEMALQAAYYKNGATVGGILTVPKGTSKAIKEELKAIIQGMYSGTANAHKSMVLEDNMKYEPIHLETGDISKLKEVASMSQKEVFSRFYGPDAGATYANAEQKGIEKVKALLPRFIVWETAFDEILPYNLTTKFNLNGLMRADSATQMNTICTGINNGLYTINEGRALLDYPPIEGGDAIRVPLNYGKLNPDGTIDNPNASASTSPFDIPVEAKKEPKELHRDNLEEKRLRDAAYLLEVQAPAKTARSKVESIMRRQIKAFVSRIKELQSSGASLEYINMQFAQFVSKCEKDFGNEYVEVFKQVMEKLAPIVKKATGIEKDLNPDAMDAYCGKLGQSLSGRFSRERSNELSKCQSSEDVDGTMDSWFDKPAQESEDEANRASNAFQVFLFSSLGLQFMHVVAAADSCEFCHGLDGKVVEVNGNILSKGDQGSDGAGNIRHIHKNYKHPPFHSHCHCGIAPGE